MGKTRAQKVKPQCPTPEALTGVQLRQVEVDQLDVHTPGTIVKSTDHTDHSPQHDEQISCNDKRHNKGVRSDGHISELASGPLREGLSFSDGCPSQA